jgi:putative membrane protein
MWWCNLYSGGQIFGYYLPHGIYSIFFWGLILFLIVFLVIRVSKGPEGKKSANNSDRIDSMEILKMRYAKGEIDKEEFNKMKRVLS